MADIQQFEIRDQPTIRDAILRLIRNMLISQGVASPNVGPKSDAYINATGLANELAVVEANAVIKADELMPDTCTGDALDRWLAAVGLSRRSAAGSVGQISITSTPGPSPIAQGVQLIDTAGLSYEVTLTGSYSSSDPVPIRAISTGIATNHLNGDVLTWVSTPPYAAPTATVGLLGGSDGLTNGVDAEGDEPARARLLARLANPPAAGNWQHVAELAEESSARVEKGFPYPAAQGPSTVHVAVTTYATTWQGIASPSASRVVDATTVSSVVTPYVKGLLAEYADVTVTATVDVPTDVSIGMALPSAPTASPAGPGGGWLDGAPWPAISGTGYTKAVVTARTNDASITVDAPTSPTAGVTRVSYVNRSNWRLYTAKVITFSGVGPYVLTLDAPLVGIAVNDYVFPASVNAQNYLIAILKAFAQMGPGEKTASAPILDRAFRHPAPQQAWPYSLGATQLRTLTESGDEVLDVSWLYRQTITPAVPGAITGAPNILIPARIGFYPL